MDENDSDNKSDEDVPEEEKKNPKEVLIRELKRLSDVFGQYSLNDR